MDEQFAPAWTDAQERAFDLRAEYDHAMVDATNCWLSLTEEQRADPEIIDRYTLIRQALADNYRETVAELDLGRG